MMSSIENQIEAGRRRMQNDEVEVDRAVFNAAAECSLPALVEALDMGAQFREVNAGESKSCDCCRLRKLALRSWYVRELTSGTTWGVRTWWVACRGAVPNQARLAPYTPKCQSCLQRGGPTLITTVFVQTCQTSDN
jgi:hypothetical protein